MSSAEPWTSSRSALSCPAFRSGRARLVALGVRLRRPHVALGVDRVVVLPVGDRRPGDGGAEDVGGVRDRVEGQVAAVGPPRDADPRRVDERQGPQVLDPGELVLELDPARGRGGSALSKAVPRAAMPRLSSDQTRKPRLASRWAKGEAAAQAFVTVWACGPAVDAQDDRVALRRGRSRRLEQGAVERRPVLRLHLEQLDGARARSRGWAGWRSPRGRAASSRPGSTPTASAASARPTRCPRRTARRGRPRSGACRPRG